MVRQPVGVVCLRACLCLIAGVAVGWVVGWSVASLLCLLTHESVRSFGPPCVRSTARSSAGLSLVRSSSIVVWFVGSLARPSVIPSVRWFGRRLVSSSMSSLVRFVGSFRSARVLVG